MCGRKNWNGNDRNLSRFEKIAKQRSISQAVRAHNDAQIPIGLHDVFVLSYCSNSKDDLHMAFTTPHNLFNWCRAYNSGHPVCLRMDAVFKLNQYQMCMYFMGFGSLGGRFNQWLYSFGSLENTIGSGTSYLSGATDVIAT